MDRNTVILKLLLAVEGSLAESIGEQRLALLLKWNLAILPADLGRFDEAFRTARENYQSAEALGLLYSRTDGRRCLAHVHFKHGELDETLHRQPGYWSDRLE